MVVDLETYLAECVCCININGDISPAGPYEGYTSESPESHASETLSYFADLKKLATHLADISCVTLEQQRKVIFWMKIYLLQTLCQIVEMNSSD